MLGASPSLRILVYILTGNLVLVLVAVVVVTVVVAIVAVVV